jgi:hypothetical protein
MNIQQPRVAEFVSFERLSPDIHDVWREGKLQIPDLIRLSAFDTHETQEQALKEFLAALEVPEGASPKDAKAAKAKARKGLKDKAKAEGKTRSYDNAGKPSRKKLANYAQYAFVNAHSGRTADERRFWNGVSAAFKVMLGATEFRKVAADKEYVNKRELTEAHTAVQELEEKAEKARARAASTDEAEAAPKKAPKKAAKKAPKKAVKKTKKKAESAEEGDA